MTTTSSDLGTSLVDSISSDNIKELSIDVAETALDAFLNEGLLKEIPFFGLFYKGYKSVLGIREAIFCKKALTFLKELDSIPKEQKRKFTEELQHEKDAKQKVGEKIIVLLEQLDDIEKAKLIGTSFRNYINGEISHDVFTKLSFIVQKAFLPDLLLFKTGKYYSSLLQEQFASLGLMSMKLKNNEHEKFIREYTLGKKTGLDKIPPVVNYEINETGRLFIKYCFD